jgi:glycerol-3-phosphate dehydrogenase
VPFCSEFDNRFCSLNNENQEMACSKQQILSVFQQFPQKSEKAAPIKKETEGASCSFEQKRPNRSTTFGGVTVQDAAKIIDVFIISGGINGCGIARDAEARVAQIRARTKVTSATRRDVLWHITLDTGETIRARLLVNAAGPWVGDIIGQALQLNSTDGVRLVRGSHIVTKKLYYYDKYYFLQGTYGRIIFAIPYETDFTLIGTTDAEHANPDEKPYCTDTKRDHLITFANQYISNKISTLTM